MKRALLVCISCGLAYITLTSKRDGEAKIDSINRTGAGGGTANCAGSGCHADNSSDLNMSIIMVDPGTGDTIKNGMYIPGKLYIIRLYGRISSGGNYPIFGFQLTAVKENGSGAGTFITPTPPNLHMQVVGPYQIIEQDEALSEYAPNTYMADMQWYAIQTSGNVTFHATMLAANDNGNALGDKGNNAARTFAEDPNSVTPVETSLRMTAYPNPFSDQLQLSIDQPAQGIYEVRITDLSGRQVDLRSVDMRKTASALQFSTSSWAPGPYFITIARGASRKLITIVKQ